MAWQEATIYPQISLSNVLSKSGKWIEPKPDNAYRLLTVRMWGKGVVERGVLNGSEMSAKRMIVVCPQQFIISRIDARNGASGLIPADCDGAIVTNDFPVYDTDPSRLLPQYLGWLSKTSHFIDLCKLASEGTTNRVRLKEDAFLKITIPLPPLEEQRRIVARIEELAGAIAEARGLKKQSIKQISSILTSELHRIFIQDENNWKKCNVGDVTEIIDPNPSHRMPNYCNSGIPFISTVDFEGSEDIRRTTAKYVMEEAYREQLTRCNFAPGDILYSRIGTIGLARLIDEVWPFALSHVLVVIKSHPSIIPRFLLWYLRSDSIISQAMEASRSIGTPDLGIKKIREFHMPLPPLGEQSEIAIKLDFLQTQVDALKRLQAETAAELDALLPSILDKAFKGKI